MRTTSVCELLQSYYYTYPDQKFRKTATNSYQFAHQTRLTGIRLADPVKLDSQNIFQEPRSELSSNQVPSVCDDTMEEL